jgi:hypothetical protein
MFFKKYLELIEEYAIEKIYLKQIYYFTNIQLSIFVW